MALAVHQPKAPSGSGVKYPMDRRAAWSCWTSLPLPMPASKARQAGMEPCMR